MICVRGSTLFVHVRSLGSSHDHDLDLDHVRVRVLVLDLGWESVDGCRMSVPWLLLLVFASAGGMCIVLVWVEFDVGVAFVVIVVSFGVEEGREVVASSIGLVDFEAQCCDSVALNVALDVASSGSSVSSRGCHCTEVLA